MRKLSFLCTHSFATWRNNLFYRLGESLGDIPKERQGIKEAALITAIVQILQILTTFPIGNVS